MEIPDGVADWLLEADNPPVRYLTLTNLLDKSLRSSEVRQARSRLMDYDVTQKVLEHADEFWGDDDRAYWKYTGKYWQLIFLGQFQADGRDPRIARGANQILGQRAWVTKSGGQCLTANLLAALTRLGYGGHPVVAAETEALAKRIRADGGIRCAAMDYSLLPFCYMAQPKLLLCFAQIPPKDRTPAVTSAIKLLADNLLENEVHFYVPGNRKKWQAILGRQPKRADLPKGQTVKAWVAEQRNEFVAKQGLGKREAKQGWTRFCFPLHYNSDVLEAMYALAAVGVPMQPKLKKPLQVINEKMTPGGRWIMENSLNGKMWADVETKGKPSKWLTYLACHVRRHFAA